jgi:hypothetical protein
VLSHRMARPTRIAALLCSLWLLTAPGWLAGSPALQTAASRQLQYDFGTVRQGDIVVHTFTLPGAAAALSAIDRVDLSHAGMSARFSPRVQAGRSASVTVTWDTGRVMGPVEGQAVVRWADQSRAALTLTLKGTVRPVIEVLPYPAVFFSVYRDESAEQMITILNRDDVPLHISRVEAAGEHFTARLREVRPGREYQVVVAVPSGGEPGRYLEALFLHTGHPTRPRVPIAVNVLIKRDVYANPEVVDFGEVSLDEIRRSPSLLDLLTQTFLVKRRGGPFEIRSVRSDLVALRIAKSPDGPSQTFRFDVALDPARLERSALNGAIRLETSDPAFPEVIVPVRAVLR